MSNTSTMLDEIIVSGNTSTEEERERELWAEREKEDRSDRNERNSYRNNLSAENKYSTTSDIVSAANTTVEKIKEDLLKTNYQNSFKEIVDKLHGNLHKTSKALDYKDYLEAFSTGFLKNDWGKLEKKFMTP